MTPREEIEKARETTLAKFSKLPVTMFSGDLADAIESERHAVDAKLAADERRIAMLEAALDDITRFESCGVSYQVGETDRGRWEVMLLIAKRALTPPADGAKEGK